MVGFINVEKEKGGRRKVRAFSNVKVKIHLKWVAEMSSRENTLCMKELGVKI